MKFLALDLGDQSFGMAWFEHALKKPYMIGILGFEILSFVLWMRILSVMDVGRAVPLTAIAYIFVLALGWFGFHEPMHAIQIIGSALILIGVFLLGTSDRHQSEVNVS